MAKPQLTQRDLNLFLWLHELGVITSDQAARFFFPSVARTTVLRRLRRLESGRYIRKRGNLTTAMSVWMIEPEGQKVLGRESSRTTFPLHQLEHEITLGEIRWRLHEMGICLSWMPERELRRAAAVKARGEKATFTVPDALVLLRGFLGKERTVKVEGELHLKSTNRYAAAFKKVDPYRKGGNIFTWYFVRTDQIGRRILQLAKKHCPHRIENLFGYTVIDDFLKRPNETDLVMLEGSRKLAQVLAPPAQGSAQGLSRGKSSAQMIVAA